MSNVPNRIPFERGAINNIKTTEDVVRWLNGFMRDLDQWYDQYFDNVENGGFETSTWRGHEATAADLEGGKYKVGDLLIQRKIDNVWQTANAFRKV